MSKQTAARPSYQPSMRVEHYGEKGDEVVVLRIDRESLHAKPRVVRFVEREQSPPGRMLLQL